MICPMKTIDKKEIYENGEHHAMLTSNKPI